MHLRPPCPKEALPSSSPGPPCLPHLHFLLGHPNLLLSGLSPPWPLRSQLHHQPQQAMAPWLPQLEGNIEAISSLVPMNPAAGIIKHGVILCFINCLLPSVCIIVSWIDRPLLGLCAVLIEGAEHPLPLPHDGADLSIANEDFLHTGCIQQRRFFQMDTPL